MSYSFDLTVNYCFDFHSPQLDLGVQLLQCVRIYFYFPNAGPRGGGFIPGSRLPCSRRSSVSTRLCGCRYQALLVFLSPRSESQSRLGFVYTEVGPRDHSWYWFPDSLLACRAAVSRAVRTLMISQW